MPQLIVDPFLLIRSPAYSFKNYNADFLKESLETDLLRAAIFFASSALYAELKKKDFDFELMSDGEKNTLWKYFNRMCFRSLPYGFFATYAAATWSAEAELFVAKEKLIVHPDFKIVVDLAGNVDASTIAQLRYQVNDSMYYSSPRQMRFISKSASAKYSIVQLKVSTELKRLLGFIGKSKTRTEILDYLLAEYGDEAMVANYFESLLAGQVIFSELQPNITGIPFSRRLDNLLESHSGINRSQLLAVKCWLPAQSAQLPEINKYIDGALATGAENSAYSLYFRKLDGGIRESLKPELLTLVKNLNKLTASQPIDQMVQFKSNFLKKYDQQEIPLLVALDPESGIGYENLATAFAPESENFVDDLRHKEADKTTANWGDAEKMIFKKWNQLAQSGLNKILITAKDLDQLPECTHRLPPGIFVMFRSIADEIWLDGVGGVSGVELSTRFGEPDTEIEANLKRICDLEAAINKDFIFAEIAFSPNDRTSNVNQRGSFYSYEIPLLTHSTAGASNIIRLNDLVITLRDQQVLLRSVKHNRYVIPRLSTAYNYKISTIPVFRFLCDLQYQGLKANLSFSLTELFPGMDYYPRLQLEETVLSPETWMLNEEQIKNFVSETTLKDLNIPRYFCLHESDNFLVFDQECVSDLALFIRCMKNKKSLKLTEYAFSTDSPLKNDLDEPLNSQVIACLINQSPAYTIPKYQVTKHSKVYRKVKRSFLPFDEWLYVKVYTHYSLTDEILCSIVLPLVKKYEKLYPEFKWFFIRYEEQGHHLRLRFLIDRKSIYLFFSDLVHKLQPLSEQGKVSDVILDSYQRELEKYSFESIVEVESFFYRDSEYALSLFSHQPLTASYKLSFAVMSSLELIQQFVPDGIECTEFLKEMLDNVSEEFKRDKEAVHKLDVKYRAFKKELIETTGQLSVARKRNKAYIEYVRMRARLLEEVMIWKKTDRYNLLINLVHMHINRIFEQSPREYEYLTYHFMKKHQAYLNHNPNGPATQN